jgi:hypothetical protein
MAEDAFSITIKHRLPLAAAFLSGAFLVPALMLALVSPMAMAGGPSFGGWLLVLFLFAQPVMLAISAIAGFRCYRRYSYLRFSIALLPPVLSLAALKLLVAM